MTHTYKHHSFLMISTINDMEACDFNGLCRKILGKRDSVILQKNKKNKKTKKPTHVHTKKTFKMTAEGLNRMYYFKDSLHVNSVLWITEIIPDRQ